MLLISEGCTESASPMNLHSINNMSRPQIYRLAHSGISMVTGPGVDYGIMHVPNTYRAVTKSRLYHHPKTLLAQRSVSPRRRSSYKTLQFPVVAPPLQGGSVSFPDNVRSV